MKNLLTSFMSTGFIQLANLATGILAARLLLPEGRGELALLILWPILIADLGSMGLNTAVAYKSARKDTSPRAIFSATVYLTALISPLLMAVYAIAVIFVFDGKRPEIVSMAWIYAALIPIHLYSLSLVSQFQGEQRFTEFNILRLIVHAAYLGFALLLVTLIAADVITFAYAFMSAVAATGVVALVMALRLDWINLIPEPSVMRDMLQYGLRAHVGGLLNIANRKLDQLLISVTLAVSDLGLYVVAMSIAGMTMLVTATTDLIAFPKLAEQTNDADRQQVFGKYLRVTLCIVIPCVAVMVLITPAFIRLLFGDSFLPAADVARILLFGGIAYAFRVSLASYLRAANRMMIINKGESVGLVITVVSLAILVPLYGIVGAAIAQLIALALPIFIFIVLIKREHSFDLVALMTPRRTDIEVFRDALARFRNGD